MTDEKIVFIGSSMGWDLWVEGKAIKMKNSNFHSQPAKVFALTPTKIKEILEAWNNDKKR